MTRALAVFLLLALSACAQPSTISPKATAAEIKAEQEYQKQFVKEQKMKGLVHGISTGKSPGPRLQAVASRIAPASVKFCEDLGFKDADECAYDIHLLRSGSDTDDLDANADGKTIKITSGMVRYTDNNDQLAMIVAHESAHNFMKHIDAAKQNAALGAFIGLMADAAVANEGYRSRGEFTTAGAVGGLVSYSPEFEQEADYIALYLLARSGYNYRKAPDFWRKLSLAHSDSIYVRDTHPTNPERYVVMRKTIAEIDEKKRKGLPLVPQFSKQTAGR